RLDRFRGVKPTQRIKVLLKVTDLKWRIDLAEDGRTHVIRTENIEDNAYWYVGIDTHTNTLCLISVPVIMRRPVPRAVALPPPVDTTGAVQRNDTRITPEQVTDLTWYFKYASSAYTPFNACANPNGQTRITGLYDIFTDTQGYIARDDSRKEIIVAFRGSTSPIDFINDVNFILTPFTSSGVSAPGDVRVHSGFLNSWNSVAPTVLDTLKQQLVGQNDYTIVTVGHSLGGAVASIAAMAIKANFANVNVRMYTYGQPRTGNPAYANWVNSLFGTGRAYRVTHTTDPVPHLPFPIMGYAHHGTEYWISTDPANSVNIVSCDPSGEDNTCSNSNTILLPVALIVLPAHFFYMDIFALTPYCG
ncbi:hypothetical protein CVT24_008744, partial [Panaeolus cyanescens]